MIERSYLWIDGPPQSGKTTFVERLLPSCRNELVLAARVVPAKTKKQAGPAKPTPETKRYETAGAIGSMLFRFAPGDPDAFWATDLVENYSTAIVFEGEPGDFVSPDLVVYVTRPLAEGQELLVKGPPGMRQADRENMAFMERVLSGVTRPGSPLSMNFRGSCPASGSSRAAAVGRSTPSTRASPPPPS